ncbi:hypothetical protein C8R46DRAFT_1184333 [Mycena filopes]|nr:hypothetical protein C8R46DRAFT_1184333 [Mycena filopes]
MAMYRRLTSAFLLTQLAISGFSQTTVPQYKEWKSIGCHGDSTSARSLHHLVPASANTTVETCLDACAAGGFILAGLEFGHECHCGNALLYTNPTPPPGACTLPCAGNASEACGGSQTLNLYQFADTPFTTGPAAIVFEYKNWVRWACINPGPPFPFAPVPAIPADEMTVERCLDGCAAAGCNAAGVQDGQRCFCNIVPADENPQPNSWESTNEFDCANPCLGNATEPRRVNVRKGYLCCLTNETWSLGRSSF